jgi:hypothetical protein
MMNAGHVLSSEMHEFAVDWIVPAKIVNYPMNGDISVGIKPIKRTTGRISSPLYGSSYRLLQVAALLIVIRPHPNFEVISATKWTLYAALLFNKGMLFSY